MYKVAMNEYPIIITNINDFIFCPVSIYFHNVEKEIEPFTYASKFQLDGSYVHQTIDKGNTTDASKVLKSISIYSEKYGLYGKIDTYKVETGELIERKKKIINIYDGYVFQLYAQYFALKDMGYNVLSLFLYSFDDNKKYPIKLPDEDQDMKLKFERTIEDMRKFDFKNFHQTSESKCKMCVYEPLCSFSMLKEV